MIVSVSSVCAQETYQYTKGRALTEAEIEVQKSLEPKLKSLLDDDNSVPLKQANRKSGLQKKTVTCRFTMMQEKNPIMI